MSSRSPSFDSVVQSWITTMSSDLDSAAHDENNWAFTYMLELEDDPNAIDFVWRFILEVLSRNVSDRVLNALAASPLENLLCYHGFAVIDRVEAMAAANSKFADLLCGVWQSDMDPLIWERVQRARSEE